MPSQSSVLKALTVSQEMTATSLARKLGMAKATTGLKVILDELVSQGQAVKDTSGRYITYRKMSASSRPLWNL